MAEFDEKLNDILNNPEKMSEILELAKGFMGEPREENNEINGETTEEEIGEENNILFDAMRAFNFKGDKRIELLHSLKKFSNENDEHEYIENAIKALRYSKIAKVFIGKYFSKSE